MGKKHPSWNFFTNYHQGDKPGCVWIHSGGWGETACHYAMNGYKESASRLDMYNKDHRQVAKTRGYVFEDTKGEGSSNGLLRLKDRINREVKSAANKLQASKAAKGKPFDLAAFLTKFKGRFGGSIKWLSLSPEGWHYGYTLPLEHVPKSRRNSASPQQPTFQIKHEDQQGYGAWYPYHHNYHHMIPESALQKYLLGNDDKVEQRVKIVCASKWNINKGLNIVLLPQELAVSRIVGLPAHCPWGTKSHPTYSRSMKDKLKDAKKQLDKAVKTQACEDTNMVAFTLDLVCESLLIQIKAMKPGKQLGRVT